MPKNWERENVENLKNKMNTENMDRYKLGNFEFERAGNDTREYLVIYKGNHVETFSMDIISVDKLKQKLEEIKLVEPESIDEWLNR